MNAHLGVGLVLNVIAFAALGCGPTMWALRGRASALTIWALSPAVGTALVTVAGTWLVAANRPVSHWAMPLLVAGFAISLALTLLAQSHRDAWRVSWREGRLPAAVFVLAAALMILPQLIGGLQYSVLRGNGADSFFYIAVAGYLDHEPLSWIEQVDTPAVIDRNPAYVQIRGQLQTHRWATMMLLAFASRIAALEPLEFEYVFSVLMLLITFGPVYAWCRDGMGAGPRVALACAFVGCTGFWAQFVLDERADAHQHSLPILLTLGCLLLLRETPEPRAGSWRAFGLIGALVAALAMTYPEILACMALGVFLWALTRWRDLRIEGGLLARSLLAATVTALALAPILGMLASFVRRQFAYASAGVNNWEQSYFPWLYRAPLSGLWGFGPAVALDGPGATLLWLVFSMAGLGLTVAIIAAMWRAARANTTPGLALAATLAAATLLQAAWLLFHGQRWAAGKSVSFGFPFFLLAVVGLLWTAGPTAGAALWLRAARVSGVVFIVTQMLLSVVRPVLAYSGRDYPGYILGHGEYRRHDWAINVIDWTLEAQRGATVWAYLQNPWVAEYAALALGEDVQFVNLGAALNPSVAAAAKDRQVQRPDYILLDRALIEGSQASKLDAIVSGGFALVRPTDAPLLLGVDNPNGVEQAGGEPFFWMGGRPTRATILSLSAGCARVQGRFLPGPSRPESPLRHVVVTDELAPRAPVAMAQTEGSLPMVLKPGLNVVLFQIEETPTVAVPNDPRPLLLRADRLRIDAAACDPAVK